MEYQTPATEEDLLVLVASLERLVLEYRNALLDARRAVILREIED